MRQSRDVDLKERSTNPNRHPWELSRADMVLRLLLSDRPARRCVDIGSGDIYFAERLADAAEAQVYAVDVHYQERTTIGRVELCTSLDQVPSHSADCALLMDVLEHVDDDVGLLKGAMGVLKPKGELLITVPAHAFLWSDHDEFLGHRRRYDRAMLVETIHRSGCVVEECFYFYAIPFAARAASVMMSRVSAARTKPAAVAAWPFPADHLATRSVRAALNIDFRVSRLLGAASFFRCGLSICARCRPASA